MAAEPTGERFDVKVRGNVIPKRGRVIEACTALVAGVWSLARMHADMALEIGRPKRRKRTMRAGAHTPTDLDGNTTDDDDDDF